MILASLAQDAGLEEIQALRMQGDMPALAALGLGADVDHAGIQVHVLGQQTGQAVFVCAVTRFPSRIFLYQ
jgi:hypothetical protein